MESLADILRRLRQQSTFADDSQRADLPDAISESPCPVCAGRGWFRRDVPVGHVDFGRAFPCQCRRLGESEGRLRRLQDFSNLGPLERVTFADTLPNGPEGQQATQEAAARFQAALRVARSYAEAPGGWLTLVGASGSGKTHLAAAIANRCMERGIPTFFTVVPDLLDHLRASFAPESELSYDALFESVRGVPLLVLDDLGTQSGTPWAAEKLFQVLNHRYVNALPTVITTNVGLDHVEARFHSRLTDPRSGRVMDLGAAGSQALRAGAIEPAMRTHMTFGSFDGRGRAVDREGRETLAAALTAARSFAEDPQGWLVLLGESGCGKTHLAVAIANELLGSGHQVFFAFVPDLLDHLRYTFSPDSRVTYDELFDEVRRAPLLILDDLGAQSATPWANEKLYQIVVRRHNARLPTVITTRQLPSDPKDPVASRINDPRLVTVVPIMAPSYRDQGRRPPVPSRRPRG